MGKNSSRDNFFVYLKNVMSKTTVSLHIHSRHRHNHHHELGHSINKFLMSSYNRSIFKAGTHTTHTHTDDEQEEEKDI